MDFTCNGWVADAPPARFQRLRPLAPYISPEAVTATQMFLRVNNGKQTATYTDEITVPGKNPRRRLQLL